MVGMADVMLYPEEERRRRSLAVGEAFDKWNREQIAAGLDGPVPAGRPDGSDYNQHVPLMEASAAAMDDLQHRLNRALRP
jgi:hypothetical protein